MGLIQKVLEFIQNTPSTREKKIIAKDIQGRTTHSLLQKLQVRTVQSSLESQKTQLPKGVFQEDADNTLIDLDALDKVFSEKEDVQLEVPSQEKKETDIPKPSEDSKIPPTEIEDFQGNIDKIDIGVGEELAEEELEPQEIIDLDEDADITKDNELSEWEEAAKKDLSDEFLENSLLQEIYDQNDFKNTLEPIPAQVSAIPPAPQDHKTNTEPELESTQKKLDNYLILLEITKDLVKSYDFEDFLENLMYSIEGQLGPESIIIFSKSNKESDLFKSFAFDGVEIEPDLEFHQSEPLCNMISNLDYPKFTKEISREGLSEKELSLLQNPYMEVITPIHSNNLLIGFIITGKLISGDNYAEEDLEFLKLIADISGSFILKLWDISEIKTENNRLQAAVKSHESITTLIEALYDCDNFDSLFDELNERMLRDFGISKITLFILTQDEEYTIINSNFFSVDTISKFVIKKDSKLIPLISQVTGMYKIENFTSYTELTSQISEEELQNMKEFIVFPLLHLGRLFGILVVHETEHEWTAGFKQTIIQVSTVIAPIVANLILQTKTEIFSKNPFNPMEDAVEKEIQKAQESNQKFTLVVLKVLSVTRILNLLGLEFFRHYMSFLTSKLQNQISGEDWISRIGEGKFAIFLRGKDKTQTEKFFSNLKQELVKFPNPPKDFKLSIQLYSLTFPDQTDNKRKFIELIEDT